MTTPFLISFLYGHIPILFLAISPYPPLFITHLRVPTLVAPLPHFTTLIQGSPANRENGLSQTLKDRTPGPHFEVASIAKPLTTIFSSSFDIITEAHPHSARLQSCPHRRAETIFSWTLRFRTRRWIPAIEGPHFVFVAHQGPDRAFLYAKVFSHPA